MFFTSLLAFFSPCVYVAAVPRRRLRHVCLPAAAAAAAAVAAATVVVGPSSLRCQSRSIPGGARFAAALSLDIRRRIFRGWRQGYGVVGRHNEDILFKFQQIKTFLLIIIFVIFKSLVF
jgi:hypothetical protein